MDIPLELSFRHVDKTERVEAQIRDRADKLEQFHSRLISCRVAVEQPHTHQRSGNPYRVRIEVRVPPGHDLVVNARPKDMHDSLERVISDAFQAMERQLKEQAERQRMEVKHHDVEAALVIRLFRDQDYGFLKTPEAREIYFNRAAMVGQDWERLEIGTQVRFEESMGEMGPQATSVHIIDKPGHRVPEREPEAVDVPPGWREH